MILEWTCLGSDHQETELLERAIGGDQVALQRLMMAQHSRLSADLGQKLPVGMRALIAVDDVLQETYLCAFRDIPSFQPRGRGAFYRWLARIAENRLLDAIKAERAVKRGGGRAKAEAPTGREPDSVAGWLEMLAVYERTPSQSAAGHEAVAMIQNALGDLKEDYREALRLRFIEGLPVADAAARMKRTEGAVCLLCHRGLRRLRQTLGNSTRFFGPGE